MRYHSTNGKAPAVSFRQAVLAGLAEDGGLYLPQEIPGMPAQLLAASGGQEQQGSSFLATAFQLARLFVGDELDEETLYHICEEAFSFPLPLVRIAPGIDALELFWGPTFAFKDFGARFLARVMNHFARQQPHRLTILVATSGDTGSAVAHGFAGMEAIDVVLLYPMNRVSRLQEQQLTTLGGNVTAVEVRGTFDDCQAMVKAMFGDRRITDRRPLSSANSINIGRLLPQVFYHVDAWRRRAGDTGPAACLCVPSGNFGNVTGALIARLMGLPVPRIVVGTNANDVVPRYLASGLYSPRAAVQTPASAMDVGNPSNFDRILHLLGGSHRRICELFCGYAIGTAEMLATIARVRQDHSYLLDPHGAVGFAAVERFLAASPNAGAGGMFTATAHPAKFGEAIREATGSDVEIPPALAAALAKEKRTVVLDNRPRELRELLLDTA